MCAPKRQLVIITLTTGLGSLASLGFTFLFCDACFVILSHNELLVLGPLLTVSTVAQGQTRSRAGTQRPLLPPPRRSWRLSGLPPEKAS